MSTTLPPSGIISSDEPDDVILGTARLGRWRAAVHEAGHAVIAPSARYTVIEVEVENNRYRCNARSDPNEYEEEHDAIYTLAGEKAENAFFDCCGETPLSEGDRDRFRGLGPGSRDSDERRVWRERMERDVESRVASELAAIEAVARRLISPPYRLSGAQVAEIASSARALTLHTQRTSDR